MSEGDEFISLFLPHVKIRLGEMQTNTRDLAHYTSASNALRILRAKRVTLRHASLMNDFSEIDHGEQCLIEGWRSQHGKGPGPVNSGRLSKLLNDISPTIVPAIEQAFDRNISLRKSDTFLLSLSEHDDYSDGKLGKLSMWRAYGGKTNVALVVKPEFLFSSTPHSAFSAPVIYSSVSEFADSYFSQIVDALDSGRTRLAELDRDKIVHFLNLAFNSIALATKHPGFREEREWRIISAPWLQSNPPLKTEVVEIDGIPQKVKYVELEDESSGGSLSVRSLIKKIIIGPTEHPLVLYDAFVQELEKAGVQKASEKVQVSDIPIRR